MGCHRVDVAAMRAASPFEDADDREQLRQILGGERAHDRAHRVPEWQNLEKPLLLKPLECGPDGRTAQLEPCRDVVFADRRPWSETSFNDQCAEPVVCRRRSVLGGAATTAYVVANRLDLRESRHARLVYTSRK